MNTKLILLSIAGVGLMAGQCGTDTNHHSYDIIDNLSADNQSLSCVSSDHKARLSFNRTGDGQIFFERYDPNAAQDVTEVMLERASPNSEKETPSPNPNSTHFVLSNGIEGEIAVLGSGICTDAQNGEKSNISFKIGNWGDAASSGYASSGCCRMKPLE